MARIIIVTVVFGGFALAGAVFLFRRVRRYLRWRKNASMSPERQLFLILPALVLSLAALGGRLLVVIVLCTYLAGRPKITETHAADSHETGSRTVESCPCPPVESSDRTVFR